MNTANILQEYLEYANIEDSNYSLSLNIISSYNDLGMVNYLYGIIGTQKKYMRMVTYVIYNDKNLYMY